MCAAEIVQVQGSVVIMLEDSMLPAEGRVLHQDEVGRFVLRWHAANHVPGVLVQVD